MEERGYIPFSVIRISINARVMLNSQCLGGGGAEMGAISVCE